MIDLIELRREKGGLNMTAKVATALCQNISRKTEVDFFETEARYLRPEIALFPLAQHTDAG